jgi:hypothetical protein
MKLSNTATLFVALAASLVGYSASSPVDSNNVSWCCGLVLLILSAAAFDNLLVKEEEI